MKELAVLNWLLISAGSLLGIILIFVLVSYLIKKRNKEKNRIAEIYDENGNLQIEYTYDFTDEEHGMKESVETNIVYLPLKLFLRNFTNLTDNEIDLLILICMNKNKDIDDVVDMYKNAFLSGSEFCENYRIGKLGLLANLMFQTEDSFYNFYKYCLIKFAGIKITEEDLANNVANFIFEDLSYSEPSLKCYIPTNDKIKNENLSQQYLQLDTLLSIMHENKNYKKVSVFMNNKHLDFNVVSQIVQRYRSTIKRRTLVWNIQTKPESINIWKNFFELDLVDSEKFAIFILSNEKYDELSYPDCQFVRLSKNNCDIQTEDKFDIVFGLYDDPQNEEFTEKNKNIINAARSFFCKNINNIYVEKKQKELLYGQKYKNLKDNEDISALWNYLVDLLQRIPANRMRDYFAFVPIKSMKNISNDVMFLYDVVDCVSDKFLEYIRIYLSHLSLQTYDETERKWKELYKSAEMKYLTTNSTLIPYKHEYNNTTIGIDDLYESLKKNKDARLLLYGLTGTGKSEFAKQLCAKIGIEAKHYKLSDILSKWIGESEEKINSIFVNAVNENTAIIIDECDSVFDSRDELNAGFKSIVNQFLTNIESFEGLLICTTNRLEDIDSAILRRFDLKVEFKELVNEQKRELFSFMLDYLNLRKDITEEQLSDIMQRIDKLLMTQGLYASVLRQSRFKKINSIDDLYKRLEVESNMLSGNRAKVGFNF